MIASIDCILENGTGEILAAMLRLGNKGGQLCCRSCPRPSRCPGSAARGFCDTQGALIGDKILVHSDSAGASREILHHLHSLGMQFTTPFALPVPNGRFIDWINNNDHGELAWDRLSDLLVVGPG